MTRAASLVYRPPQADEAGALAALGQRSFCESFAHLYSAEDLNIFLDQMYSIPAVRAELSNPNRQYLVVEEGGSLIGYCKIAAGTTLDYDPGDKIMVELKQFYILASHHGKGIAQIMMKWVIDQAQARNADEIILSVYSENPRAQAFYKKYDFAYAADTVFMVGQQADHEFLYIKPLIK